jgi:FkbM family methyltransferase
MKTLIKKILRLMGLELRLYTPGESDMARMGSLLLHHEISLVLDVGANIGQYGKYLREAGYSGRIVSFEPLSNAYAVLKKAGEKDPLWEIAPRAAVGNMDGEIMINVANNSVSSSILPMLDSHRRAAPESTYIGSESVKLYKLDTIVPQFINDTCKSIFLKMDVQGFELQVLEGASGILPRIKGLQLEVSLVPLYEGEPTLTEILEKLDQLNYELYAVIPGFTDMNSGRLLQLDCIFFRKQQSNNDRGQ